MFVFNLVLALAWIFLTGEFSPLNFLIGFIFSFLVLYLVANSTRGESAYIERALRLPGFLVFFLVELTKSNMRVAYDVLTPTHHMKPGIVAVPLEASTPLEITLLANLITLTPGTLSLDVSHDRKTLYVHSMYLTDPDSFRKEIKENLERRLLELLR